MSKDKPPDRGKKPKPGLNDDMDIEILTPEKCVTNKGFTNNTGNTVEIVDDEELAGESVPFYSQNKSKKLEVNIIQDVLLNKNNEVNRENYSINNTEGTTENILDKNDQIQKQYYDLDIRYRSCDNGPFVVYVESEKRNIGRLHAIRVGHFLHSIESIKNSILNINAIGINKIKILLKDFRSANDLINHRVLKENGLIAYIPRFFVERKGLIRSIDTMFDETYLKNKIEANNMCKVSKIKRLTRKIVDNGVTKEVPRQLVSISFLGTALPREVVINSCIFPVEPFIYPVIQCYKCLRYGHMQQQCKGTNRCKDCGEGHEGECPFLSKCIHCGSDNHSAISRECPEYKKQRHIKEIMANHNVSFKEALSVQNNPSSYANITTGNRFSLLSNDDREFPPLPNTQSNTLYVNKPKVQPLTQKSRYDSNEAAASKKRKVSESETYSVFKVPSNKPSTSILPNPHRDEFMIYKEKLVDGVSNFINNLLIHIVGDNLNINSRDGNNIKESVFELISNLINNT